MPAPYIPTALGSSAIVNPTVGAVGAAPIPYISISEYQFAPTAMSIAQLIPGGTMAKQQQALADVIRRASRWADSICFGADPAGKASLAASVSVESQWARVVNGELRLFCDYRPIVEVVGIDVGVGPTSVSTIGSTLAGRSRVGRRTIVVPFAPGYIVRSGDSPAFAPFGVVGRMYAVWSYVFGYAHTRLATSVAKGATTCVVTSTDGSGGLWGAYPASGTFLGTQFQIVDGASTEIVSVKSIETGTATTTLTTSAFRYAHTVPQLPDFIPVTALPEDIHQACITLASMLVKTTRGSLTLEMPQRPGQEPDRSRLAQAGAIGNWENAKALLHDYGVRQKASKVI